MYWLSVLGKCFLKKSLQATVFWTFTTLLSMYRRRLWLTTSSYRNHTVSLDLACLPLMLDPQPEAFVVERPLGYIQAVCCGLAISTELP
ncbi:hypothetical protein PEC730217_05900 [Pectobacterium carotovorum subsp. carotovorum]|nr:hypothetical protein PEC730217_05900 [Pectobacterium carotovorum subsp. carotovorum]